MQHRHWIFPSGQQHKSSSPDAASSCKKSKICKPAHCTRTGRTQELMRRGVAPLVKTSRRDSTETMALGTSTTKTFALTSSKVCRRDGSLRLNLTGRDIDAGGSVYRSPTPGFAASPQCTWRATRYMLASTTPIRTARSTASFSSTERRN